MGMSASQVRFLSLQNRKSDVGKELETLSNRKLALARDMNKVSKKYTNALSLTSLKWSNNSGSTYNTIDYNLLMKPGGGTGVSQGIGSWETPYVLTDSQGRVVIDNENIQWEQDGSMVDPGVSYYELAQMISTYSGYEAGATTVSAKYDNTMNLINDDAGNVIGGLKSADNCEYQVVRGIKDFDYENTLRFQVMQRLGLIDSSLQASWESSLVALYGTQEAKESGVYPAGSAWGDYWIAVGQLEAYDSYIKEQHAYALGNTYSALRYSGSGYDFSDHGSDYFSPHLGYASNSYAVQHETYTMNSYDYDSKVNGSRSQVDSGTDWACIEGGWTTVKQTSKTAGSLTRVDWSYVVLTDADGNYSVYTNADCWAKYDAYDMELHNKISGGEGGSLATVSNSGEGIVCYYGQDDLMEEAFANLGASGISGKEYLQALSKRDEKGNVIQTGTDSYGAPLYITATDGAHYTCSEGYFEVSNTVVNLWTNLETDNHNWAHADKGAIRGKLNEMCNQFKTLMQAVTSAKFDNNEAFTAAKAATIAWLMDDSHVKDVTVSVSSDVDEGNDCYVRAGAIASGHGIGSFGNDTSGWTRDRMAVCVDTAVAFDIFMTVYQQFDEQKNGYPDATAGTFLKNNTNAFNTLKLLDSSYSSTTTTTPGFDASKLGSGVNHYLNAHYDNNVFGKFKQDDAYRDQLVQNVEDKKAKITELEDDLGSVFNSIETKLMDFFDIIMVNISKNGWVFDDKVNMSGNQKFSQNYLNAKLDCGKYFLMNTRELSGDGTYMFTMTIAENIKKVFRVHDVNAENKALAEYENEKSMISMKEKKVDNRMTVLETEQEAISTEMSSLKKVKEDNINRYFKIFA